MQFSPLSRHLIPLRSTHLYSAPCSQIPSIYVPPLMSETKFYTHTEPHAKLYSNFYRCLQITFKICICVVFSSNMGQTIGYRKVLPIFFIPSRQIWEQYIFSLLSLPSKSYQSQPIILQYLVSSFDAEGLVQYSKSRENTKVCTVQRT
jgi:hypothetical protein